MPRDDVGAPREQEASAVCIVSTASALATGGLPTYVRFLAAGLAARRRTTTVARFARDSPPRIDYAACEPRQTIDQGAHVSLTIVAPPRALRPLARAAGRLVHRPITQRLAIALFVGAYAPVLARAIPRDARLVHSVGNGWELLGFAALRVARRRGAAFTVLPAVHPGLWGDGPLDGRLYAAADRVLALSASERTLLQRLGVDPSRIDEVALGPGVGGDGDGARFRLRHGLGDRPIVLFVGRKEPYKGYHALCEAVERVRHALPVTLVAIGGPVVGPAPRLSADALLDLGAVDDRETADALAACDVLCLASTAESFGIVCVEAWQYGRPVIVGPAPASHDLVEHGVTGLHVRQRADDIEAALLELLRQPAHARAIGARGQALQRERYTWAASWRQHAESFERAIAEPRASPVRLAVRTSVANRFGRGLNRRAEWLAGRDRRIAAIEPFSIVSNDCWGGEIYRICRRPYLTPFVGLILMGPCYIRLLSAFEEGLDSPLREIATSRYAERERHRTLTPYPLGLLTAIDAEVHFLHYASFRVAADAWARRRARLRPDRLFVKTSLGKDGFGPVELDAFARLPLPNKLVVGGPAPAGIARAAGPAIQDAVVALHASMACFDPLDWLAGGDGSVSGLDRVVRHAKYGGWR